MKVDKLRRIPLFANMSESDLKKISEIVHERDFAASEIIIEERTEPTSFYVIDRGKVEIAKGFEGNDKVVLSIQSDGAFFGEMAILDGGKRSATVMALEKTSVLEIKAADFEKLLYMAPVLAYRIMRELSIRLRESNALTISSITQKTRQLYRSYIETITMVVQAIEERNARTKGHNKRVTLLSMGIGREIGLREEDMRSLELSALLHDLGLLRIPEKIFHKKTLTAKEKELIHKHPLESVNMISSVPMLQNALLPIKYHHERFDGSGYPDGLKGDQIPLLSRILAVADAYEAMTRESPVHSQTNEEEALREIKRCAGSQFDPKVVEVFAKVLSYSDGPAVEITPV